METTLTWPKLLLIWVVFAITTTLLAVPGFFLAIPIGGLTGLVGYWFGISEETMKFIGTLLGVAIYLGGSMIALKYTLSKTYRGFKIVLTSRQD